MEDYYNILEVPETATSEEIKKAYRKKSKEFHPDVNPDGENQFKKIAEAYDVLSDPDKKQRYDNQKKFGGGGEGMDPWDLFRRMQDGFAQRKRNVQEKLIKINISVLDSYNGVNKTVNYTRNLKCDPCNGSGGERTGCSVCNGVGYIQQEVGNGFFRQIVRSGCPSCRGEGSVITKACFSCSGSGVKPQMENINITIPMGIDNGQYLRLEGMGDFISGMYGNLLLQIEVFGENNFDKNDNDLIYTAIFNLDDLQKESFDIPHPDGLLTVKVPKEFDTDQPLRIKGKGFKMNPLGDLYVKLRVKLSK
jgi:molecular chaperone DnaJ